MKKSDRDSSILCEIQAKAFELSADMLDCSSEIFIRRFMNSEIARCMDQ